MEYLFSNLHLFRVFIYKDLCSLPPPFMHQDFIPVCDAWGVGVWVCGCVGKDLIFTYGRLNVDKISPHWILPKTIPGNGAPESGET